MKHRRRVSLRTHRGNKHRQNHHEAFLLEQAVMAEMVWGRK